MLMSACLETMIVTIAHVLSVEILRVALNVIASQAILEMENLAAFLVRKKLNYHICDNEVLS